MTPTAVRRLDHAGRWNVSRSELIRQVAKNHPAQINDQAHRLGNHSQYKANSLINSKDLGSHKGEKAKENKQPS